MRDSTKPARVLASAVLLQAWKDLRSREREDRAEARAFFHVRDKWLRFWCVLAEQDPQTVCRKAADRAGD